MKIKISHLAKTSKRHISDWSRNTKQMAEEKVGAPGKLDRGGNVRVSPYVRPVAKRGSKNIVRAVGPSPSTTAQRPSGQIFSNPRIATVIPQAELKATCTFVTSIASLCSKSTASCKVMSEPEPFSEDMFLLLVPLCGVREAEHRANVLGIPHQRSSALLAALINGPNAQ